MPHCPPEYSNCKVLQIVFITGIDKSTRKKRRKTYATFIRFVCFMSCKSELNELKFQAHGGNKPYEKYVDIKIKKKQEGLSLRQKKTPTGRVTPCLFKVRNRVFTGFLAKTAGAAEWGIGAFIDDGPKGRNKNPKRTAPPEQEADLLRDHGKDYRIQGNVASPNNVDEYRYLFYLDLSR